VLDVTDVNELDARLRTASAAEPPAGDLARAHAGVDQLDRPSDASALPQSPPGLE
jgi:hypothetical protein